MTYYIYHIPGIKIGCTNQLEKRMSDQGFTEWEILETHDDGWLAGDREQELQKEYGLPVDKSHYMISLAGRSRMGLSGGQSAKESGQLTAAQRIGSSLGGKAKRSLTFEQAQEIRANYKGIHGEQVLIGLEYGVSKNVISDIICNKKYLVP